MGILDRKLKENYNTDIYVLLSSFFTPIYELLVTNWTSPRPIWTLWSWVVPRQTITT